MLVYVHYLFVITGNNDVNVHKIKCKGVYMKALFLGGDKRQLEIINDLYYRDIKIDVVGYEKASLPDAITKKEIDDIDISDYHIIVFPVSGVKGDLSIAAEFSEKPINIKIDLLMGARENSLIFTGIKTRILDEMLRISKTKAVALMDDEEVKKENGIPTVEGILGDIIYNTSFTINGSTVFVIGYGNIGKRLVRDLIQLGAKTIIGVKDIKEFSDLKGRGFCPILTNNTRSMAQTISNCDVIINTVPSLIIDAELLRFIDSDTYVLDISSFPHGIDFEMAEKLNIQAKTLLGIPSLVAPKTAGKILSKKINHIIKEGK